MHSQSIRDLVYKVMAILMAALFHWLEVFFAYSAQWANPVCRKIFKCCSRSDSAVFVTDCRIIYISADYTYVLFHFQ